MKRIVALFLAALILLSFAACSQKPTPSAQPSAEPSAQPSAEPSAPPAEPQKLVIAHRGDPTSLCHLTVTNVSVNGPIFPLLYDTLIYFDSDSNSFKPGIATNWEQVDDTHLKLYLRKDVIAHDGSQIKASDVIYTINSGFNSGKLTTYYSRFNLDECKVVDEYTVILGTKAADPYLEYILADPVLGIVSETAVTNAGTLEDQNRNPVAGSGPYTFVSWEDGQRVVFARNENYWGPKAFFDTIEFSIITDVSARQLNLESGDVDLVIDPDLTQMQTLIGNPSFQIFNFESTPITVAWMNCSKPPFDDVNVRRAVALALDYESNVEVAYGEYGYRTDGIFSKKMQGYAAPDGSYTDYYHYDLEAAKAMLAQSNYPNGFSFTIQYANSGVFDTLAQLIKNQLAKLNIDVTISPQASAVVTANAQAGTHDMYLITLGSPIPSNVLRYLDGRLTFAQSAYAGWKAGEEFYSLLDLAESTIDAAARHNYLKQIQAIVNTNVPMLSLGSQNKVYIGDADIAGIKLTPMAAPNLREAYRK